VGSRGAPAEAVDRDLVEDTALATARLVFVLGALALLEALEHLMVPGREAQLRAAADNVGFVLLELVRAVCALRLDVLGEHLACVKLGGAYSAGVACRQALLGADPLEVGIHRTQALLAAIQPLDGLRELLPGQILAALAQGTDAL
jgi:hypothetical protein